MPSFLKRKTLFLVSFLTGVFMTGAELKAAFVAIAAEGDVVIIISGKRKQVNPGDKVPNGAVLITGKESQAILQWEESFDLQEVTPETKIKISGKKIIGGESKKVLEHE